MPIALLVSSSAKATIKTFPVEVQKDVESELEKICHLDPYGCKPAPSPPYAAGAGHLYSFKVRYKKIVHYVNAMFSFSDDLDEVHVTHVFVSPSFERRPELEITSDVGDEVISIPLRPYQS